jgi:predicted RNase H-like HicB family nuclease
MTKFNVVFEPDDGGWHVSIPSVRGCRTWGRSLEAGRRYIREALAACVDVLGEDAASIAKEAELVERFKLPPRVKEKIGEYRKSKRTAERVEKLMESTARGAARELAALQFSLRDAGELLGLSHEQVRVYLADGPKVRRAERQRDPSARR